VRGWPISHLRRLLEKIRTARLRPPTLMALQKSALW